MGSSNGPTSPAPNHLQVVQFLGNSPGYQKASSLLAEALGKVREIRGTKPISHFASPQLLDRSALDLSDSLWTHELDGFHWSDSSAQPRSADVDVSTPARHRQYTAIDRVLENRRRTLQSPSHPSGPATVRDAVTSTSPSLKHSRPSLEDVHLPSPSASSPAGPRRPAPVATPSTAQQILDTWSAGPSAPAGTSAAEKESLALRHWQECRRRSTWKAWRDHVTCGVSYRVRFRKRMLAFGPPWLHRHLGTPFPARQLAKEEGRGVMAVKFQAWRVKARAFAAWALLSARIVKGAPDSDGEDERPWPAPAHDARSIPLALRITGRSTERSAAAVQSPKRSKRTPPPPPMPRQVQGTLISSDSDSDDQRDRFLQWMAMRKRHGKS